MDDNSKKFWQEVHDKNKPLDSCSWLGGYKKLFYKGQKVLDLGCGYGNDTKELLSFGCNVVSTDLIQGMVDKTVARVKGSKGFKFDMENDDWSIFSDSQFDAVVAGLSLHYFSTETTRRIIQEIKRILRPDGYLVARVNSTKDKEHGSGGGKIIEANFYVDRVRGNNKRYFDEDAVMKFFSPFGKLIYKEIEGVFNGQGKFVFEIMVKNNKQRV